MKSRTVVHLAAAAGLLALGACSESTSPASLVDQTTLTTDVASSSGDAVALDVEVLSTNEGFAGLVAPIQASAAAVSGDSISYTRTRNCYDSTGAGTTCGTSAVRTAVLHVTFTGFRADTAENGAIFTGNISRTVLDTLFRIYTGTTETSRQHDGLSTGSDTVSFVGPSVQRLYEEAGSDSVEAVTYNLPRIDNPWPISGKIVRNVSVHATFTSATRSSTTDVTKRVEVDFPPDNQGNVVLKIDNKTCNLNLVTHHVSNCQ
ncbi:MAG TPA: hypothetical protein VMF70_09010 [Gemmatimonadales bacterium]|nr:hypothetical protein [Gemmatimonadales bacterium]